MDIKTISLGADGDKFPMLDSIWDFFSSKGSKTVFVSVGSSPSPLPELEIGEMLGCKLHLFEPKPAAQQDWEAIKDVLKTRKAGSESSDFVKAALKKWVLPRNIHLDSSLPFLYAGELLIDGDKVVTSSLREKMEAISETLGFTKEEAHIDLLKIDLPGKEHLVLSSVIEARFRPSLLVVRWTNMPDEHLNTMLAAAHLQTLGYRLLAKEGSKFLYYYNDTNYYESCSWEVVGPANPLVSVITKAFLPGKKEEVLKCSELE